MTSQPKPQPSGPPAKPASTWQFKLLVGIIALGVLSLILKTAGLF